MTGGMNGIGRPTYDSGVVHRRDQADAHKTLCGRSMGRVYAEDGGRVLNCRRCIRLSAARTTLNEGSGR